MAEVRLGRAPADHVVDGATVEEPAVAHARRAEDPVECEVEAAFVDNLHEQAEGSVEARAGVAVVELEDAAEGVLSDLTDREVVLPLLERLPLAVGQETLPQVARADE